MRMSTPMASRERLRFPWIVLARSVAWSAMPWRSNDTAPTWRCKVTPAGGEPAAGGLSAWAGIGLRRVGLHAASLAWLAALTCGLIPRRPG
jgi:hypothetical protein